MAGNWRKWALAGLVVLVVAYAWIDGGREDLREITYPVATAGDRA